MNKKSEYNLEFPKPEDIKHIPYLPDQHCAHGLKLRHFCSRCEDGAKAKGLFGQAMRPRRTAQNPVVL